MLATFEDMSPDSARRESRFAGLALVLSGGGARACYQVGVLAAIAERVPDFEAPILTGVSAGAINAASLAAFRGSFGAAVRSLRHGWKRLTPDQVYCVRPTSVLRTSVRWALQVVTRRRAGPGVVRGLMDMAPLRAFLGRSVDFDGIARHIQSRRLDAVALSATSYTTGRTVTFVQGCEDVPMWERAMRRAVRAPITVDHVIASASIPIIFPAVRLPDGFYGDGSVRQTAPLAPAIHLGARRIITISMRKRPTLRGPSVPIGDYPTAAEVMSLLFNSVFLDTLDADAERLDRINQLVAQLPPDRAGAVGLREVDLLLLRPSRDLGALAKGHEMRLPRLVRYVVQGIGGQRQRASDLLSYLMFEPTYTEVLMDLGYSDALAQWSAIEQFIARCE